MLNFLSKILNLLNRKIENIYEEHIIQSLGFIPKVNGSYNLDSKILEIHPSDFSIFDKLFKVTVNKNYGNGELALYWLLRNKGIEFDSNRKKDLKLNDISIEIKNFTHVKLVKIGKIPSSLNKELMILQRKLLDLEENYLISQLNKTRLKSLISKLDNEFINICKHIIVSTIENKIGEKGYIINFKSSSLAHIYMVDVNNLDLDKMINHFSFNEGYLHLDLESIFNDK